jgi:hypothetical protein
MKTKTTKTIVSAAAAVALAFTGATHAAEKLNIYCWSEYIPQDVIDDFSQETGIKVSVENYAVATSTSSSRANMSSKRSLRKASFVPSTKRRFRTSKTSIRSSSTCRSTPTTNTPCHSWREPLGSL